MCFCKIYNFLSFYLIYVQKMYFFVVQILYYMGYYGIIHNMANKYKINNSVFYYCTYHVVWCVKYKRKLLQGDIKKRLYDLIYSCSYDCINVDIIDLVINDNYVYICVNLDPQYGIHKYVRYLKAKTCVLRDEFNLRSKVPTLWTMTYLVSTNVITDEVLKDFMDMQKKSQRDILEMG